MSDKEKPPESIGWFEGLHSLIPYLLCVLVLFLQPTNGGWLTLCGISFAFAALMTNRATMSDLATIARENTDKVLKNLKPGQKTLPGTDQGVE